MNKKFSIVKAIDINKLRHEIDDYINYTGEEHPYIFMSTPTLKAIEKEYIPSYVFSGKPLCGHAGEIKGYKIFTNDDLTFGEVEIR